MLICRTFIFCEQNELFWEQNQTKTFQMADPLFRLYVSVYEINKVIHGRLEISNLSSHVQYDLPLVADQTEHSKINSISLRAHLLFSIPADRFLCLLRALDSRLSIRRTKSSANLLISKAGTGTDIKFSLSKKISPSPGQEHTCSGEGMSISNDTSLLSSTTSRS